MAGYGQAIAEFFKTVNRVLARMWGTQTAVQASLEEQAEHAATEKRAALDQYPPDLDAANHWERELTRLQAAIAAKRG